VELDVGFNVGNNSMDVLVFEWMLM